MAKFVSRRAAYGHLTTLSQVWLPCLCLHCGADLPRLEFVVADAQGLGFGLVAGRRAQDQLEDAPAVILNRFLAIDDGPAIDVHVVSHAPIEGAIRGELE